MERRNLNLIINKDGHGTTNYKIALPKIWVDQMELSDTNRNVIMSFDGKKIIIEKGVDIMKILEKGKYNVNLVKKLYDYLDFELDNVANDIEHDYLTRNESNGKEYYWYMDENKNALIDMEGNIITDEDEIQKIMKY